MQKNETKLFNQKILFLFVFIVFLLQMLSLYLLSERFSWGEASLDNILSKSLNITSLFFAWIIFLPIMPVLKKRVPYSDRNKKSIVKHFSISIILAILIDPFAKFIKSFVLYFYSYDVFLQDLNRYLANIDVYMLNFSLASVAIYWAILVYLTSMENYEKYQRESLKRANAENLLSKAELTALKMQIQPHFLFNTLHSVNSLIDEDKEEAQDVVAQLGNLLRYTLDQKSDFISLEKELEFIQSYLAIEEVRFKERLQVRYEIASDAQAALVPSFILQALIENSIKHNLSKNRQSCIITICGSIEAKNLNLAVIDNGSGAELIRKGIGLENTESRLKNYYGKNYSFSYGNTKPQGFAVKLSLPLSYESDTA